MTSAQLYLRLLGYVKPYWVEFAASIIGIALVAASEVVLPMAIKPFLDGTFVEKDPFLMKWIPIGIVGIFFLRGIGAFVGAFASAWVGNKVVLDLRAEMFRKILRLPTGFFDNSMTGNLISKITFDVTQVTNAATQVVNVLIKDFLILFGLMAWLLYLNWKLTLITFLMVPPIAIVVRVFNVRLRNMSRRSQEAMGDINNVLQEAIECHKVVKIFGGKDYESKRFFEASNRFRGFVMKQAAAGAANVPITQILVAIATAVVIYQVTLQASADRTTVGGFVSFIGAMLLLSAPLKRLAGVSEHLQRGLAASESVFGLIDQETEQDTGTIQLGRAQGALVFENVSLQYEQTEGEALSNINLQIQPGETIALVGQSGSGKTSLANLIPRFYQPSSGRILLDGHDLGQITLSSLRANVGLVSQDVSLFNDTIAANIAYGAQAGVSEAQIIEAAEAAHAMEFIRALPEGMNTLVGENGVRLSGGQRQRLAIARTLLKNAPVLILDEATSALDTESERAVQEGLETLMQGRTTIVIAHRLSTIEKADRIVVLDQGEIVETGTHAELVAREGVYSKLQSLQFSEEN
ncbi:MAG: lipid A export permease/ATP-binding protein MsbA [Betaproteobacteria bacterium]|nr:lipid A export permease/ATP-binding protein MsbA [Betaproteobacteria bacterium]